MMANKAPPQYDWTFVSGGHSNTNASSASGLIIDLQRLNSVEVLKNFKLPNNGGSEPGVVSYGPGATWGEIEQVTAGSGWVAIGARCVYPAWTFANRQLMLSSMLCTESDR